MTNEIESLQAKLNEQARLGAEREAALLARVEQLNEELRARRANDGIQFAGYRGTTERLQAQVAELTRERDDALKALDENWVQHQRIVAVETKLATVREKYTAERDDHCKTLETLAALKAQAGEHDEDLLEQLYWEFDADRKAHPENERIRFKGKLRFYANRTAPSTHATEEAKPICFGLDDCSSHALSVCSVRDECGKAAK